MRIRNKSLPLLTNIRIRKGTPVLIRADLDVAIAKGKIRDASRIQALLPALHILLRAGARIRIIAHRGRPEGNRRAQLSLAPVGRFLVAELNRKIIFIKEPFGKEAEERYGDVEDILLFENLRFWPGEEENDAVFTRSLARWGDVYVNEAFANCHRAHASMIGLPRLLPAYAGPHLVQELEALKRVMEHPRRPLVAVLGGAKIETKLPLIRRLLRDADRVLIGGALANTLFAASGQAIGRSLTGGYSKREIIRLLKNKKLFLPIDVLVAPALRAGVPSRVCLPDGIQTRDYIADIGPATAQAYATGIARAKTVIWNGPMGFAEVPAFAQGTIVVARAMRQCKGFTVVGGGDTLAALSRYRLTGGFSHVSIGGGAMLMFLAGEKLPAIKALKESIAMHHHA